MAVVITVIASVRRVISNDQRLTEYSRLYISNTFLSILAVPNKALFCITPTLHVILSFPIHLSNSVETLPMAPITTGTISTFLNSRNFLISFFKCWYFSTFSFSSTFTSTIIRFCSFLSITIRSGHLASIRLSHWIFMSHSTLISSYSTAPSGVCSYHFSLCLTCSFYKYPNELSLQHFRVVFCILFETIFHIRLLFVAHFLRFSHTIYTGGFHWSYRCGTSYSLS